MFPGYAGLQRFRMRDVAGAAAWGWLEDRLVRLAGAVGLGHRVVDLEDQVLGAERTVLLDSLRLTIGNVSMM